MNLFEILFFSTDNKKPCNHQSKNNEKKMLSQILTIIVLLDAHYGISLISKHHSRIVVRWEIDSQFYIFDFSHPPPSTTQFDLLESGALDRSAIRPVVSKWKWWHRWSKSQFLSNYSEVGSCPLILSTIDKREQAIILVELL